MSELHLRVYMLGERHDSLDRGTPLWLGSFILQKDCHLLYWFQSFLLEEDECWFWFNYWFFLGTRVWVLYFFHFYAAWMIWQFWWWSDLSCWFNWWLCCIGYSWLGMCWGCCFDWQILKGPANQVCSWCPLWASMRAFVLGHLHRAVRILINLLRFYSSLTWNSHRGSIGPAVRVGRTRGGSLLR